MRTRSILQLPVRFLPIVAISLLSSSVFAQSPQRQPRRIEDFKPSAFDCHRVTQEATDPVSSRLAQVFDCYSGGLIAIAEEIPADKYIPQHILGTTVGHNVGHVAYISGFACSKLSGDAAPKPPRINGEADKDGMVEWLKSSAEFCKKAFSKLSDAKLGESVPWNGFDPGSTGGDGNTVTRFAAALWVTNVMIERYGAFAGWMQTHETLSDVNTVPLVTGIRNQVLGR
jgi:hypothetical protein